MLYAKDKDGNKITAFPTSKGFCPMCDKPLVAKCGRIKTHHWAHASLRDCDGWWENESEWHLGWKKVFNPSQVEVIIENETGKHRADIFGRHNTVIELQNTYIKPDDIKKRESFYGRMIWIFNAIAPYEADRLHFWRKENNYASFCWRHPRKSMLFCNKPVFLDLGGTQLFQVRKVYDKKRLTGWGFFVDTGFIIRSYINGLAKEEKRRSGQVVRSL